MVSKLDADGVNENGEYLVDFCAERSVPYKHLSIKDDPLIYLDMG